MGTPEKPSSAPVVEVEGAIRAVSELILGSRIVYPNQGVCRVGEILSKEIAGQRLDFVSMTREEDGATILVPVNKVPSIGLRHVADSGEIGDVFDLLASSFDDPELDWKVRHRMHGDLMAAGGVLGVAEVLKALQGLANLRPLPQKERERYDAARHLLVHEIAVALGVPEATAEDFIDLALIPPPGTVRPASKPRRLATLPPRFLQKPPRTAARGVEGEEEEFGLLDEELPGLGIEEEGLGEGEEEAEGEEAGEGAKTEAETEEGEEKPKAQKVKTSPGPKKPKRATPAPLPERAETPTVETAATPPDVGEEKLAVVPVEALAAHPTLEPAEEPIEEVGDEAAAAPEPTLELEPAPGSIKAPAKKADAEKPVAKKTTAKKPAAKGAEAEGAGTPKPKKAPAKTAAEKAEKKPAPKKAPTKRPAAKEAPAKKPAAKPAKK